MNDLTEAMRCATDSPPPTRIDVDGLLRTHRGRRATQWMAATGGALVLAVTAVTASTSAPPVAAIHWVARRPRDRKSVV